MITNEEILTQLRRAINGEIVVRCEGATWEETYSGYVTLWFGDWKIEVFNDCNSFDYINSVEAPDGRRATFEDWWEGKEVPDCPESQLSRAELDRLEELLKQSVTRLSGTSRRPEDLVDTSTVSATLE